PTCAPDSTRWRRSAALCKPCSAASARGSAPWPAQVRGRVGKRWRPAMPSPTANPLLAVLARLANDPDPLVSSWGRTLLQRGELGQSKKEGGCGRQDPRLETVGKGGRKKSPPHRVP